MVEAQLAWLVWITPLAGALLTPLLAKLGGRVRDYGAVGFSLLSALFAALLIPVALEGRMVHSQVDWIPSLGIRAGVLADPLSVVMANVVAWVSFLIMVYSLGYMKGEPALTRYWFLMNLFIGNMQLIVLSDNLLQLFFGWEGVGLCSYALIGFWHSDEKERWVGTPGHIALGVEQAYSPSHAGMKAFVTTRVGDVLFLIGLLTLYYYSGTFEFLKLAEETGWAQELLRAGLLAPITVLIFGGAVGKSAQFPLHEWLPDAMAGPTAVSALIHAATMVKAGVFLVGRMAPIFFNTSPEASFTFFTTVAWVGAFTAFLAATQAVVNREVKKVLAYSTVSQIGYMMLALGVAGLGREFLEGFTAGFFHLISHAIFKAALFMAAGALLHAAETKYMDEMGGLRGPMRMTFYAMLITGASLAGIPPLSGFWSKDAIILASMEAEHYSGAWALTLFGVVTALITAFYTFRMIGLIFYGPRSRHLEELEHHGHHVHEAPRVMLVPYSLLAVATVGIGLLGPLFETGLKTGFSAYLEHFGIEAHVAPFTLHPLPMALSLAAVAIGGYLGYHFYMARRADPARLVAGSPLLQTLQLFLVNRWYINSIYYIIFVKGVYQAAKALWFWVEQAVIDRVSGAVAEGAIATSEAGVAVDTQVVDGAVNGTASVSQVLSQVARRLQTGITQHYVVAFALGIIIVLLLVFGV
jgi:NADH-quinone oxidoreductase subunit L